MNEPSEERKHVCIQLTANSHVLGDPNMSQETRDALVEMMKCLESEEFQNKMQQFPGVRKALP